MRFICLTFCLALVACDAPDQRLAAAPVHAVADRLPTAPDRIRGVTLDARHTPPPDWLPRLAALGVSHVTVIPFAFQQATDDPALRTNYDARWYTESRAGIGALARQADSLGLHVVIKPQIWMRGAWSAESDLDR